MKCFYTNIFVSTYHIYKMELTFDDLEKNTEYSIIFNNTYPNIMKYNGVYTLNSKSKFKNFVVCRLRNIMNIDGLYIHDVFLLYDANKLICYLTFDKEDYITDYSITEQLPSEYVLK